MDLHCTTARVGEHLVVAISGVADLSTVPQLQGHLATVITAHPGERLVVDIDGVVVLDDVALGLLLGAAARARQLGGDLGIVCTRRQVRDRLAATRLDQAVAVRSSIA